MLTLTSKCQTFTLSLPQLSKYYDGLDRSNSVTVMIVMDQLMHLVSQLIGIRTTAENVKPVFCQFASCSWKRQMMVSLYFLQLVSLVECRSN